MTRHLISIALASLLASCVVKPSETYYERKGIRMSKVEAERVHADEPPVFVSANVDTPPKVLRSEFPAYPQGLVNANVVGSVTVQFVVGIDGEVRDAKVLGSPPPELAALSIDAITRWKFLPGISSGRPVAVRTRQTFEFKSE